MANKNWFNWFTNSNNIKHLLIIILFVAIVSIILYFVIKGIHDNSRWLGLSPPPKIEDKVVVYVSSGLFNLGEILYSQGWKNVGAKDATSQIVSDHIPTIVADDFEGGGGTGFAAKNMLNLLGPPGGMMESIAEQKHWITGENWESYIPARDGFNMAVFMQAATKFTYDDVKKEVPSITAADWNLNGIYLLMAVYGYDMYNLICRTNCCIFNGNGITKDSGSVAELGIATARGFPLVIYQNSLIAPFANLLDNPMVLGAAGEFLSVEQYAWTIPQAVSMLDTKLQNIYTRNKFGELNFCSNNPPAYLPAFWATVGKNVWNWRYIQNIYDDKGNNLSKTGPEWTKWWKMGDEGKAYIVARIIQLVRDTQIKFFGISETDNNKFKINSEQSEGVLAISNDTLFFNNTALGQNLSLSVPKEYISQFYTMMFGAEDSIKPVSSDTTSMKVFMNWPVWNLQQECEMLITSWYVARSQVNNKNCLPITKLINCPYWAIREACFIPVNVDEYKPSDFKIKGDDWKSNNFAAFKTLRLCAQVGWWASLLYWVMNCDIILSEGNDIVIDPGVVTIGAIGATLGVPSTVWRNDARLLWNQGMNPTMLSTLMPDLTEQSLYSEGCTQNCGILNSPIESNPTSPNPVNNIQNILRQCWTKSGNSSLSTPSAKLKRALFFGSYMYSKNKLDFTPQSSDYKKWGIEQLQFITSTICEVYSSRNSFLTSEDAALIYNNMGCSSETI